MNKFFVYFILCKVLLSIIMDKTILFDGKEFIPLSIEKEDGSGYNWNLYGYFKGETGEASVFYSFKNSAHSMEFKV